MADDRKFDPGQSAHTAGTALRVALFTGAYNHIRDGVSLTLNRLVGYLGRQGVQVRVFAPTSSTPALKHEGSLEPVPSFRAPGRPDYRISRGLPARARQALRDFRPTLYHIATPDLLGIGALRHARRQGVPVVASYHTHFASYLDYYGLGRLEGVLWSYLRWFYARCEHVYVPSDSMAEVLRAHGVGSDLRSWPRGVETSLFDPARRSAEWRRSAGAGDDDVVVTFVSRIVAEKGIHVVADVLEGLAGRGIPHRGVIVGDGPARAELAARLPRAHFTGMLQGADLACAYASSDVFLFPSDTETFGNVTLEAMASGLPAVCADATGSGSLVGHGETGFLAPPGDSAAFLEHVARLIQDQPLRRALGRRAREAALGYDWELVLARILGYYCELA